MEYIKYVQMSPTEWDNYLKRMTGCTFNYTSDKIEFDIEYSQSLEANESFLVWEGNKLLAVAVIYIEQDKSGGRKISWNGGYCSGICINSNLSYKEQEKYAKKNNEIY